MSKSLTALKNAFGRLFNSRLDPLIPPPELDFVGGRYFKEIGDEFLGYFIRLGELKPDHQVLDVGCGIGRMARPLTQYLSDEGCYTGFDIVQKGIDWCIGNISSRYPNFTFKHANIYNRMYNPDGIIKASEFRFPLPDKSCDFVFLTSVFTHLLPPDLENYVSEIARVMKDDARVLATFFILDEEADALMAAGRSSIKLPIEKPNCRIALDEMPEDGVGYGLDYLNQVFIDKGLEIPASVHPGSWCGRRKYLSYQDILVLKKSAASI